MIKQLRSLSVRHALRSLGEGGSVKVRGSRFPLGLRSAQLKTCNLKLVTPEVTA